ncbi:MAG: InlB B-repeat-containing protein [Chitinispirillales bacterium]|jgi:uncharacterized repeat protein (TIGR02543 family)|nr:InlB B-repeat-containing protein [Chitinispirillales bacterium]
MRNINVLLFISFFILAFVGCSDVGYRTIDLNDETNYSITFESQGGSPCKIAMGKISENITFPSTTRDGYTFSGWFTASSGGTKVGEANGKYKIAGDITLYAQWTKIQYYTIIFDSQSGSNCETKTVQSGESINLPSTTRDGYTFSGWFTASSGGTKVGEANGKYKVVGDITLYAQWKHNEIVLPDYTIIFDSQGGSNCPDIPAKNGESITLPGTSKINHKFSGWFSSPADGTKIGDAGDKYIVTDNKTLYANWEQNEVTLPSYTITFDSQDGSNCPDIPAHIGDIITLPSTSRSGYTFNGWFTLSSGGNKANEQYTVIGDITLYAQWTKIQYYTITFDAQGGNTCSSITVQSGQNITLPNTSRSNYTFLGWFTSSSGGNRVESPYQVIGDGTLYAQWTEVIQYTVSFNSQGGTSCLQQTVKSGENINLPFTSRSGYTFNGWFTQAAGGTKIGDAGSSYTVTKNITLYAQWIQETPTYTVSFDTHGGSNFSDIFAHEGDNITLPTPTRSGYTFNGWFTQAAGGAKIGNGGGSYAVVSDITLHAQWTQIIENYTITFNSQSGTTCASQTVPSGQNITLPNTTRDHYTFNGWYTSSIGGTRVGGSGDSYTVTGSMTLYAQWTATKYTVKLVVSQSGTDLGTQFEAEYGTLIPLPPAFGGGSNFLGWSETPAGAVVYNAWDIYTVVGDKTLYARW